MGINRRGVGDLTRFDCLFFSNRVNAEGLRVSLKSTLITHQCVEGFFTVVPERRVPEVVGEASEVNDIDVDGLILQELFSIVKT